MKENKVLESIKEVVSFVGNLEDTNFKDTPKRFYKYLVEIGKGYKEEKLKEYFKSSFETKYDGMVVVSGIKAVSMCPHHLLPVIYEVDVVYIPSGRVLGLSKVVRVVRVIASQPLLQEDFTNKIVEKFEQYLNVKGVMVLVSGLHTCMLARGVKSKSLVRTSQISGIFKDIAVKSEALEILKQKKMEF